MEKSELLNLVDSVDWSQYDVEWYDPKLVAPTLRELIELRELPPTSEVYAGSVHCRVLYAIGNDHAGSYYPAILPAAEILLEVAIHGSPASRESALLMLIDLTRFYADTGDYPKTNEELDAAFRAQIASYAPQLRKAAAEGVTSAAELLQSIDEN